MNLSDNAQVSPIRDQCGIFKIKVSIGMMNESFCRLSLEKQRH